MNKVTLRELVIKTIDKYIKSKTQINQVFNSRKIQNIKHTIYQMIMECLEINVPLINTDKYIELMDVIIPKVIENYNENLPIKIHILEYENLLEKLKTLMKDSHPIIKTLIKREIQNFYPKEKSRYKNYGFNKVWSKFIVERIKSIKKSCIGSWNLEK